MKKNILAFAAIAALAISTQSALAQSSLNIGPPPGQGGQPGGCLAFTVAGSVYVRLCPNGYTASGAGTNCSGQGFGRDGNYRLLRGGCTNGQNFLGGSLSCFGAQCTWQPSQAGRAAGFRTETVYVQYQ